MEHLVVVLLLGPVVIVVRLRLDVGNFLVLSTVTKPEITVLLLYFMEDGVYFAVEDGSGGN